MNGGINMRIFKRDLYLDMLKWKDDNRNSNLRRTVLKIGGQRQTGKTTLAKMFGENEYNHVTYLNLAHYEGNADVRAFIDNFGKDKLDIPSRFKQYDPAFTNDVSTLIIIDEIQESSAIYSTIRVFAEELNCDVLVTGSYLGQTIKKEYWESAGDYLFLSLDVLSFSEFLSIFNKRELYESLDIFGGSGREAYNQIYNYYNVYRTIGGYPKAITRFLVTRKKEEVDKVLENNFSLFCKESVKYLDEVKDRLIFDKIVNAIIIKLNSEKKGLDSRNFPRELSNILKDNFSMNVTITEINAVLNWLIEARVIIPCGKAIDCSFGDVKLFQRFYISDLGMARYQFEKFKSKSSDLQGMLSELFVVKSIYSYQNDVFVESAVQPCFGTYKDYEIDGLAMGKQDRKIYGVEVKTGNNKTVSLDALLAANKIDYGIAFKHINGATNTSEKKYSIPIIMAPRFNYDLGEPDTTFDLPTMDLFNLD